MKARAKAGAKAKGRTQAAGKTGARKGGPKVDPDPKRALTILKRLKREFPEARCALEHETPHQLLVATILSAQCTDARVNAVTPSLFARCPDAQSFADAVVRQLRNPQLQAVAVG